MKSINWKYITIGIGAVALLGGAGVYWFLNNQPLPLTIPITPLTKLPETYGECLASVRDFSELRDRELK